MALVVETGSGDNLAANSYANVDDLRTYAECRGVSTLQFSDKDCEALLIKAMDFLASKRSKWKGERAKSTQPLCWPRREVWDYPLDGELYSSSSIPNELFYGQLAAAIEAMDHDLLANTLPSNKGAVIKQKVDGIETVYENRGHLQKVTSFAKAETQLHPLYRKGGLSIVRM